MANMANIDATLLLATLAVMAGCGVSQRTARPNPGSAAQLAPDFAGTAVPGDLNACLNILPEKMSDPFNRGSETVTAADYQLVGCWRGALAGKTFVLDEYFSPHFGGGIALRYGADLVAHLPTGSGAPAIVRFSGEYVCSAQKAGAYFDAVNIRTGSRMHDDTAQQICPPPVWPPSYVLGLRTRRFPVDWHTGNVY
jgi:hypothetical protein